MVTWSWFTVHVCWSVQTGSYVKSTVRQLWPVNWNVKPFVKRSLCCRFDDFDDAIDEAIEEDVGDLCGGEWTTRQVLILIYL